MKISLGYLKDCIAFTTSIICIFLFVICKKKPPKYLLYFFIFSVFIFDGLFTFFSQLHNYEIDI